MLENTHQENPKTKWVFAICRLAFFLYLMGMTTFRAATSFCGWKNMDADAKWMLAFDISIVLAGAIITFLDTTASRLLHIKKARIELLDEEPSTTT